ncbi:hypothetical protein A6769_05095 [Nostoc punctiforme NIES-2108]|uniref:Uncharacterized protein n=1 Tax=Nostoc punctiforme NIES-2108 TaxID=1356359 RepID=A0A367RTL2_NOSPU|nr:hypothetical protein A6769_05095 [Nostoc punctiforme NIES-2108]
MNPEAKHIVNELRHKFYSNFAATMNMPVLITGTSYSSNSPIASWMDRKQRLNYINVYAYTAPDKFVPFRPFILRVAINKSAGRVTTIRKGQICRGLNLVWDFELTVLPKEILDFLPWIVNLVEAHEKGSPLLLESPPHSFELNVSEVKLFNNAWTEKAWLLANPTIFPTRNI